MILAITLVSTLLFACVKDRDSTSQRWHLVHWYGTIAGISRDYPKGTCTWDIEDNTIKITMNIQDNYLHSLTTGYSIIQNQGEEAWQIDSLGTFTKTTSNDTLFLKAPCCDFIDYILVKD
ncbi:MAG: hypothetical protein WAT79_12040 [Saprospiraceae bacterium]